MGHHHAYTIIGIYLGEKFKMHIAVVVIVVGNLLLLLCNCGVSVSLCLCPWMNQHARNIIQSISNCQCRSVAPCLDNYRPVWGLGSLVKVMIPNFDIFHTNPLISRQPGLYSVFTCIYNTQNAQPLRKHISGPYLELLHEPDPKDPAKSDVRPMCWLESRIGFGCMRYW